ncbi:MAG: IF-2-associated domain-containing protein, partial [Caulobacteraceae bacterium]|nr:IF-2-associated domain-containing protein [Caulobacter sp.]
MSDTGDNNGGRGDTGGRRPLSLGSRPGGSVSSGTVKQSFSHGRTKTVVVETKRARSPGAPGGDRPRPASVPPVAREGGAPRPAPSQAERPAPAPRANDGNLSSSEADRRQAAVNAARAAEERRQEQARREAAAARAAEEQRQAAAR